MKNKSYTIVLALVMLAGFCAPALASEQNLAERVARTVLTKAVQQTQNVYGVQISLHWEKEITLGDMMLRRPRRPARKEQVIKSKHTTTDCLGVLTDGGARVLFPSVCLQKNGYVLESMDLSFQNGSYVSKSAQEIVSRGEISQLEVPWQMTAGLPAAVVSTTPENKSLQAFYGEEMTSHLRTFFHDRNIFSCRVRRGLVSSRPNLTIGEPLVYQGRVVALVKEEVSTYADGFGGVSESAFAIVR